MNAETLHIRAIIFDVGGVLIRTEDRTQRARLEASLGLKQGAADAIVFNDEMGQRAQRGEITSAILWAWVGQQMGLDAQGLDAFRRDFWAGDQLDLALVDFVRVLRGRYQTAIISNAMDDLNEIVTLRYPMADAFDLIVGSAYEGIMKPDARIFERTLMRLERAPHEAVFIDDFAHNVEGARAVGMHAIHYQPNLDLVAALAELGVKAV